MHAQAPLTFLVATVLFGFSVSMSSTAVLLMFFGFLISAFGHLF